MTVDQPLFVTTKEIQWLKADCLGETYYKYIEECTDQMPLHEKEWELSKEAQTDV